MIMAFLLGLLTFGLIAGVIVLTLVTVPQIYQRLSIEHEQLLIKEVMPMAYPVIGVVALLSVFLSFLQTQPMFWGAVLLVAVVGTSLFAWGYMAPQINQSYELLQQQKFGADKDFSQWRNLCLGLNAALLVVLLIVFVMI
ncbi:hypothetical protein [Spartinivicinus poritis]|uniref:DUF1772 domain-containing protein n=1 Tax=Spartinivicinus poritis TaxID=2994640 RepID=A0ABT5U9X2_9GAMM|nr:hypothetical protein [Spartinivicinus sp. A2-2]MDE1462960.1 hypothetical protein [Spartinivicinus sp. A2-2]